MRFRRHLPHSINWDALGNRVAAAPAMLNRRSVMVAAGFFAAAFLAGYALAALVFFPTPIFAAHQAIPRVIGMTTDKAREALVQLELKPESPEQVRHPTAAPGTVVWQDPPAGVVVPQGTSVQFSVSVGPQRVPVPDVAGYDAQVARLLVESAGLRVGSVDSTQTASPRGVTVNTRPPAGTPLVPGGRVTLVVSVGAPTIPVPSLVGLTMEQARMTLEQAGLALGTYFSRTFSGVPVGTVIEQRPAPGTLSAPGTAVHIVLARSALP